MRERRAGVAGQIAGIAESVGHALRRRQRDREPRVVVYDAAGHPRTLSPEEPAHDELLDVAARMLALVGTA